MYQLTQRVQVLWESGAGSWKWKLPHESAQSIVIEVPVPGLLESGPHSLQRPPVDQLGLVPRAAENLADSIEIITGEQHKAECAPSLAAEIDGVLA